MKKNILFLLFCCFFSLNAFAKKDAVNIYEHPREMPKREIVTEQGNKVEINDFDGEFLLIVFWSKNCVPCIKELDNLSNFAKKVKNDQIRLIMLSPSNEWSSQEEQRNFVDKFNGQNLDLYLDTDGKLAEDLGIFTTPHTVLVNMSGQEIGRIRGTAKWDDDRVIEYIKELKVKHG